MTTCELCGAPIKGRAIGTQAVYRPPMFCDNCGAPHPWLDREGRIHLLENRLEAEGLDPAVRLKVEQQLEALRNPDLTEEEEEVALWKRFQQLVPAAWAKTGVQQVVTTLVTAWAKRAQPQLTGC